MRYLLAFVAGVSFCMSGCDRQSAAAVNPAPKLIIVISVDQFAASVYERYSDDYTAGLKRLSSGIAFPVGYQSHAATETCPGHSTILTGDHPAHTGIVANSWFERSTGATPYCVSVPGIDDPFARGPQRLKVSTFGDWLKQAHPASRVVSISGKDRAAIMMAGHRADLVAWWTDGFVNNAPVFGFHTSQYAVPSATPIQAIVDQRNAAIANAWRHTPPRLWPTDVPAECRSLQKPERFGDIDEPGTLPPPAAVEVQAKPGFDASSKFADALHASPMFDALALHFAADMAERWKLGKGPTPDLLAISLSATDYVGHRYGNGGPEMCEQVHALDQNLGKFLQRIDALGVPYLVVLTADHGSVDAPERLREQWTSAQRVQGSGFVGKLNAHLRKTLAIDWNPIEAEDAQQLYVNSPGSPAFLARVRVEAVEWLNRRPEVQQALTREQVAAAVPPRGKSPADLTLAERLNEGFDSERSADIFVEFRKNTTFGWPKSPDDSVAGHGSPWDYDRQVPILFWWRGAPSVRSKAPVETVDIAPTLANIVGLRHPPVDGRCLPSFMACAAGVPPGR